MSCQDISQLLPWYLNGTVTSEERHRLDEHLQACTSCRAELADTLWAAKAFTRHPSSRTLVELAYDREVPHQSAVLEHLQQCTDCAEQLRLIRESRRLEDDNLILFKRPRQTMSDVKRWRSIAVAAMIAGVVGLGGWIRETSQSVEPIGRFSYTELISDSRSTRGPGSENVVILQDGQPWALIVCPGPETTADFASFAAEWLSGKEKLWRGTALRPDPLGDFQVLLPTAELETHKQHSLKIYGVTEAGEERLLDSCSFAVERAQ